ncbi:MAG: hypothetical protein AAFQ07_07045 [Chloroflexota bacterium]
MGYFSQQHLDALTGDDHKALQEATERMTNLHQKVFKAISLSEMDLNLLVAPKDAVNDNTLADPDDLDTLTVAYTRSRSQAVMIEKLMGREDVASVNNLRPHLHPAIELRLWKEGFVIEVIAERDAWYDQQNLMGKISISRHKQELYTSLMGMDEKYRMGFWKGVYPSEMHLASKYFQHPRIMDEWISTFHPLADWLRLGIWYEIDDETLTEEGIVEEVMKQIRILYRFYIFFLWTNENNFRDFYTNMPS